MACATRLEATTVPIGYIASAVVSLSDSSKTSPATSAAGGMYAPNWWKLSGTIKSLGVAAHHSIRFRIDETAENPGGLNIFRKGFGMRPGYRYVDLPLRKRLCLAILTAFNAPDSAVLDPLL